MILNLLDNNKNLNTKKQQELENRAQDKFKHKTFMSISHIDNAANSNCPSDDHQLMMQVLKRYLHQNNLSLYCFQNQTNQTLLEVIADYLSTKKQQLHTLMVEKFKEMLLHENLPKRLMYVYSDPEIVNDYQKDPQLVSFYKITYELICAIYEVKVVIYKLLEKSDKNFVLNAMIVNPKGSQRHIQLARVGNAFYRVQQQFHQQEQFSLPSIQSYPSAKSSSNLNSQQKQEKQFSKMRQPFKSQQIIVDLASQQITNKSQRVSPDYASSGSNRHDEQFSPVKLAKNKSVNFQEKDFIKNQSQFRDDVSLGSILDKEEAKDLLSKCSNFGKQSASNPGQKVNLIHQNNHMPQMPGSANMMHSPDMMYYYYLSHPGNYAQGYPGKSEPYLPYVGHSISPSKNPNKIPMNVNNSPVKSNQPCSPLYPSQQSQDSMSANQPMPPASQTPSLPPLEIKEGERYKGRLKFFDEGKNYGFIILDADESDLFVHFDDLFKAGITKEKLKTYKLNEGYMQVKFTFKVMVYFGKYRQSRKAVQLQVIEAP